MSYRFFSRILKNQSGFSMAEVMMGFAMAGALSVVMFKMNEQGTLGQKRITAKSDTQTISGLATSAIGNPTGCSQTFGTTITSANHANNLTTTGTSVANIKNSGGNVMFTNTTKIGAITITDLRYQEFNNSTKVGYLVVSGTYKLGKTTTQIKKIRIPINVTLDGSNNLLTCAAAAASDGGDIWQIMTGGPIGIFYNSGSVLIGSGTANTGSSTPTFGMGTSVTATGANSMAIGNTVTASGANSIAMGNNVSVSSYGTLVIGSTNSSPNTGDFSLVGGQGSSASGWGSLVFGSSSSTAAGSNLGVAIGTFAQTSAHNAKSIGSFVSTTGAGAMTLGDASGGALTNSTADSFKARFSAGYQFGFAGAMTETFRMNNDGSISSATSTTLGEDSVALGYSNNITASGDYGVALGFDNDVTADSAIALGRGNVASGVTSFAVGEANEVSNIVSTAIGYYNTSSGAYSTAIGYNSTASGTYSIALGTGSTSSGHSSIAHAGGTASQNNAIALAGATASGVRSFGVGTSVVSSGNSSFALGTGTTAAGNYSVGLGYSNVAGDATTDTGATAIGYNNSVTSPYGMVFGVSSSATGDTGIAVGNSLQAVGQNTLILGFQSRSTVAGTNSQALGLNLNVEHANNILIGNSLWGNFRTRAANMTTLYGPSIEFCTGSVAGDTCEPQSALHVQRTNLYPATNYALIGVGTRTPNANLHIAGNSASGYRALQVDCTGISGTNCTYKSDGNTAWGVASDQRLKKITGKYKRGLNDILKLKTYYYRYKDNDQKGLSSKNEVVGIMAQDVQPVFPEAIYKEKDGYLGFVMDPIIWGLVNAVQEQNREMASLKQEHEELKSALCELHPELKVCLKKKAK